MRSIPYVHKVLREIEATRERMLSGTLSGTEEGGLLLKDMSQQRNLKVVPHLHENDLDRRVLA